jgi:Flp pilus assembly protein TadG
MSRLIMPRLTRTLIRRLGPDTERGAVAAAVAVVLGAGVLLGMATVVVDVGRLYAEREQLQSGADAAVWAVAEECARTPGACGDQLATAEQYANQNAVDGAASVTEICGSPATLPDCTTAATNNTACLGARPADGNYVEVRGHHRGGVRPRGLGPAAHRQRLRGHHLHL